MGYLLNPDASQAAEGRATSPVTPSSFAPTLPKRSSAWTADEFFLTGPNIDYTAENPALLSPSLPATTPAAAIQNAPGQSASSSWKIRGRLDGIEKRTCHICRHRFREASALRKHIRSVHEKVRNYACSICNQRFGEKSNMRKHVLARHRDERPHACTDCAKRFHFTDGLARHIRNVHQGLRPFACARCGFQFKQRTHLQKHDRNMTCSPS